MGSQICQEKRRDHFYAIFFCIGVMSKRLYINWGGPKERDQNLDRLGWSWVSGAGTSVHAVYSMQVDMLLSFCQCTVVLGVPSKLHE